MTTRLKGELKLDSRKGWKLIFSIDYEYFDKQIANESKKPLNAKD